LLSLLSYVVLQWNLAIPVVKLAHMIVVPAMWSTNNVDCIYDDSFLQNYDVASAIL
jgi:hypothetical protein